MKKFLNFLFGKPTFNVGTVSAVGADCCFDKAHCGTCADE